MKEKNNIQNIVIETPINGEIRIAVVVSGRLYTLAFKKREENWYLFVSNLELISFPQHTKDILNLICKHLEVQKFMARHGIKETDLKKMPTIHDPHFFTHYSLLIDY